MKILFINGLSPRVNPKIILRTFEPTPFSIMAQRRHYNNPTYFSSYPEDSFPPDHFSKPSPKFLVTPQYPHFKLNRKRQQLEEGNLTLVKYTEIERENRILLEKIHKINSKSPNSFSLSRKNPPYLSNRRFSQPKLPHFFSLNPSSLNPPPSFLSEYASDHHSSISALPASFAFSPSHPKPHKLSPLSVDIKQSVLKKQVFLGSRPFVVDILKGRAGIRINARDLHNAQNYSLEIPFKEVYYFTYRTENWDLLLGCLQLDNNELSLQREG
jgi:hypothetical protein